MKVQRIQHDALFKTGLLTPTLYSLFYLKDKPRYFRILLLILLPLLILSAITYQENAFFLGSLSLEHNGGKAIGMSFLGDTMVWPFCIIVPLVMMFTFYSLLRTKELFDCIYKKINESWIEDPGEHGYSETHKRVQDILYYRRGYISKFFKFAPIVVITLFWAYNTLTCGFNGVLDESLYPYKTDRIVVSTTSLDEHGQEIMVKEQVTLESKIALPKWDCDFSERPMSCLVTRLWTLIFYGIPPFLLFKLINCLWALTHLLKNIKKWEEKYPQSTGGTALEIEPYSRDGIGGLSALPEAGMAYFYNVSAFSFLVVMAFLKEGAGPSWHNYLILLGFVPIMIWALLNPTLIVHHSIVSSKDKFLEILSSRSQKTFRTAIEAEEEDHEVLGEYYEKINALDAIHSKIDSIPEWPFSYSAISKIAMTFILPVAALLWDTYIGVIAEKIMSLLGH